MNFEDGTEHGEYNRRGSIPVLREKLRKHLDQIQAQEGKLEGETETSDKFSAKYGRRASRTKPKTALYLPEGRMDDRTSNQEYLSNLDYEHAKK